MRPKARYAIARALELDPDLAETYIASGWLKMFDWDEVGAERDFKRAIELNPNNSAAHRRYAFYLCFRRRFNEALAEDRVAIDLAPLDIMPQALLAFIYDNAGMADKEIEQANRVLELDPTYTSAYHGLGDAYAMKGEWSKALAAYEHPRRPIRLVNLLLESVFDQVGCTTDSLDGSPGSLAAPSRRRCDLLHLLPRPQTANPFLK
jgi:tetratricopeptide (TPR) repeat protein